MDCSEFNCVCRKSNSILTNTTAITRFFESVEKKAISKFKINLT